MRNEIKIALYVIFLVASCVFGILTRSTYRKIEHPEAKSPTTNQVSEGSIPATDQEQPHSSGYGNLVTYGGIFFVTVVALGLLVGRDVSHYLGNRVVKGLYNEEGDGVRDPDYEVAEQAWANGNHLEAISLMREYLKKNPREQHAALRIAEIYEKDLHNPLAAALEYEEILKQKLPPDRWGWSAIHLCNLYTKLNQTDKMIDLLRRIDSEYPSTPAAEKARRRLEDLGVATAAEAASSEAPIAPPPDSGPQLPPGFTLKKS